MNRTEMFQTFSNVAKIQFWFKQMFYQKIISSFLIEKYKYEIKIAVLSIFEQVYTGYPVQSPNLYLYIFFEKKGN